MVIYREWIHGINEKMELVQKATVISGKVKVRRGSTSEDWVMVKRPEEDNLDVI